MSDEAMYTPKQVAEALGISDQTIYRWIAAGVLRATPRCLVSLIKAWHA